MIFSEILNKPDITSTFLNFDNAIRCLIKNHGLPKATVIIKSFNSRKKNNHLDLYEYIIEVICETWDIHEQKLFNGANSQQITEARRSTYIFIHKYLKYSAKDISEQFNKNRTSIFQNISEHKKMMADSDFHKDYIKRHQAADMRIKNFIDEFLKKK